jgi:hypothetical protein
LVAVIVNTSEPEGEVVPVFKNTRIVVSSPVKEPAEDSSVLFAFLILEILSVNEAPPVCVKESVEEARLVVDDASAV